MSIVETHREVWSRFASDLSDVYSTLGESISQSKDRDLHETLKEIYGHPYREIRQALKVPTVTATSDNIGSITGLFFEQAATAIVVPALRRRISNLHVERNKCSKDSVRALARDPDLYLSHSGRDAVVEFKVAPKKANLDSVLAAKQRYEAAGVGYFFVGGHVSATSEGLRRFKDKTPWACFMTCSPANEQVLAEISILDDLCEFLSTWLAND